MAGTILVLSVRSFLFFYYASVVLSARGLCGLLVIFSASSVGTICGKRSVSHITASRTKSCMVLTRSWQPLTTFKKKNHPRPPSRDKLKLSPLPWNASPNKIATWKSSCARKAQHQTIKEQTKKKPALREGTKRDPRPVTPQADRSDKTCASLPSQTQLRHLLSWRCRR